MMARSVEIVHEGLAVRVKKFIYFVAGAFDGTYQPICFASALALKDNKGKKIYQGKHIPTHTSKAAQYGNMEFRHRGKSTRLSRLSPAFARGHSWVIAGTLSFVQLGKSNLKFPSSTNAILVNPRNPGVFLVSCFALYIWEFISPATYC